MTKDELAERLLEQARKLTRIAYELRHGYEPNGNEPFRLFEQWWLQQGGGWNGHLAAQIWISRDLDGRWPEIEQSLSRWENRVAHYQAHNWLRDWAPDNQPPKPIERKNGPKLTRELGA